MPRQPTEFHVGDTVRYIRENGATPAGTLGVIDRISPDRIYPIHVSFESYLNHLGEIVRWGNCNCLATSLELVDTARDDERKALEATIKELTDA
jgi:hypothetical protein